MRCGMCLETKVCNKCNTCSGTFCKPCLRKWVDKDSKNNGSCTICKSESKNLKVSRSFETIFRLCCIRTTFLTLVVLMLAFLAVSYILCGYALYSCFQDNKCHTQMFWYVFMTIVWVGFSLRTTAKCFTSQPLEQDLTQPLSV